MIHAEVLTLETLMSTPARLDAGADHVSFSDQLVMTGREAMDGILELRRSCSGHLAVFGTAGGRGGRGGVSARSSTISQLMLWRMKGRTAAF